MFAQRSESPSSSHHDEQDDTEGLEKRGSSKKSSGFLARSLYAKNENESVVSKGIPIRCVGDDDDDNDDDNDDSSSDNSNLAGKEILFNAEDNDDDSEASSDDCSDKREKESFRDEIVFDVSQRPQKESIEIDEDLRSRNNQNPAIRGKNRTLIGLGDDDDTGIGQARLFATAMVNESNRRLSKRDLMRKEPSFSLRQIMTRVNSFRNIENQTAAMATARASTFRNKSGKRGPQKSTSLSQSFRNISLGSVDSIDEVVENYNDNIWLVDYSADVAKEGPKHSRADLLRKKPVQACISLIVALLVISVVAFTSSKAQSSVSLSKDNNTTTAAANPDKDRFDEIVEFLTETTSISSLEDLNDPATPQFQAAHWLADEDPERLPIPKSGADSVETGVVSVNNNQVSPFGIVQRYVLLVLYFALGGDAADNGWTNRYHFASDLSECSWHERIADGSDIDADTDLERNAENNDDTDDFFVGVICDRELQVRQISLPNNNLEGSIPSEIQFLSTLEFLNLKGNSLVGPIPENLQDLMYLTHLDLSNNHLSGQSNPLHWLGHKLTRLEFLNLSNNLLDVFNLETIPNSNRREPIGGEVHLKTLGLGGNIPEKEAGDERSTYSIPDEIRYLTNLQQLSLHNSTLGGRIPAWLFHELNELQSLDLSHNQLTGSITDIFPTPNGSSPPLQHLKALLFHDNKLTGTLPESIGLMSNLATVTIHQTDMTVGTDTANLICWNDEGTSAVESLSTDCEDSTCPCCLEICCDGEDCHLDVDWHSVGFSNDQQSGENDGNNRI